MLVLTYATSYYCANENSMSFFKKLFSTKKPNVEAYITAMHEMADESERTYRGMVQIYNQDSSVGMFDVPSKCSDVFPSGQGLYKARLFGALFMVHAYTVSGHTREEVHQMVNLATGIALFSLVDSKEVSFSRNEAKALIESFLWPTLKAITAAFKAGPVSPMSPISTVHVGLADFLHEALIDTIGVDCYSSQVRERFQTPVIGNVSAAMAHSVKWIFA